MIKNRYDNVNLMQTKKESCLLRLKKCRNIVCHVGFGFDLAACATTSKIIANTFTYPLETVRLLSLCDKRAHMNQLYKGFLTYIPYCIASNLVTYKVFYGCLDTLYAHGIIQKIFLASFLTSFITSFYKVPYSYFIKNRIIGEHVNMKFIYSKHLYSKALLSTMSEDIPELFIKFYFNTVFLVNFPSINPIASSLLLALITSIAICPMEFWKTSVLCNTVNMHLSLKSIFLRIMLTVTNLFTFFISFNILSSSLVKV